jgi:thioredoxin reductase (NADPH)
LIQFRFLKPFKGKQLRMSLVQIVADTVRDVIIIGGGLAGLSAAIYLGRSQRDTILMESGHSMAVWEPDVQNYLGFPDGIPGSVLLNKGRAQVRRFGVQIVHEEVEDLAKEGDVFRVDGTRCSVYAKRVLLATGLTHLPPDIPGVRECLGRSLFFCKDCDALRVKGKRVVIIGSNNDTVDYALSMLAYSPCVMIATNVKEIRWDVCHHAWLREYDVMVRQDRIVDVEHQDGQIRALHFERGPRIPTDAVFTTKGDVYHTSLAECVGAELDEEGQIKIDHCMHTSVPGLYAAGCVTPANCQMMIAAGQGATAAQAINRALFEDSLQRHALPVARPKFSETVCRLADQADQ